MYTTIALTGSPSEQANILNMLRRYGLVNASNEITPDQAESFYAYTDSQERSILGLEKKAIENGMECSQLIKGITEKLQQVVQSNTDFRKQNRKQTRCLAAKSGTIKTLRAIIQERNANIDFVEDQVVELEKQVAALNKKLDIGEVSDVMSKVIEVQEEIGELELHQKTLSARILDLKQANKGLVADRDDLETRIELLERRLEKLKENGSTKRKRQQNGEDAESEVDQVHESECKRVKIDD
ncbi:hypothetical protein BKA65DRAFT_473155 [Rhexocercosporidium sp. MPI-PUGE-AT-0058]|nr:hypothetical protein BKA65DRAFT_473155 [Rhexocercosporidium sp. MPI-PUGE-AT-0058]